MILFRCDSSTEIGTGHVYRCLALSNLLKSLGEECKFLCQDLPGNINSVIRENNYAVEILKNRENFHFLKSIAPRGSWLVIDNYATDSRWESQLSDHFKIFVIDDLHNREHVCQVLLDQNFHKLEDPYQRLVPETSMKLLGPSYSLLRQEFVEARSRVPVFNQREKSVLAFFGGGDPTGESLKFVKALRSSDSSLKLDLLISKTNPYLKEIQKLDLLSNVQIHISPEKVSELMLKNSLYFGSGGTVTWERMSLGLPGVVVSVADNQTEIAQDLADEGQQDYLGISQKINYSQVLPLLEEKLSDSSWLEKTSIKNMKLVRAVPRSLLKAIFLQSNQGFEMTVASREDAPFLFELRNDPSTRQMFLSSAEVSWEDHIRWFQSILSSKSARIYIAKVDGERAGQFRVKGDFDTSISVSPRFRGKGLAARMIEQGSLLYMQEFSDTPFLKAQIKAENLPSQAAFEKAGYIRESSFYLKGEEYFDYHFPARI